MLYTHVCPLFYVYFVVSNFLEESVSTFLFVMTDLFILLLTTWHHVWQLSFVVFDRTLVMSARFIVANGNVLFYCYMFSMALMDSVQINQVSGICQGIFDQGSRRPFKIYKLFDVFEREFNLRGVLKDTPLYHSIFIF